MKFVNIKVFAEVDKRTYFIGNLFETESCLGDRFVTPGLLPDHHVGSFSDSLTYGRTLQLKTLCFATKVTTDGTDITVVRELLDHFEHD